MSDSDDDVPQLSAASLSALQEFYKEREDQENQLKAINPEDKTTDITFDENWVGW